MIATLALFLVMGDELKGELRVKPDGEGVKIDVSVFASGLLEKTSIPRAPTKYVITCRGQKIEMTDWTAEIPNVKPGEDILITHEPLELRVTIAVKATEGRHCEARKSQAFGKDVLSISVSDPGEGDWKTAADEGFTITTKEKVLVNELAVCCVEPLAKCATGSLSFVPAAVKLAPRQVAEMYLQNSLEAAKAEEKDQHRIYCEKVAPLWPDHRMKEVQSDKTGRSIAWMHFKAVLGLVKNRGLKKYEFAREDPKARSDGRRGYYFSKENKAGDKLTEARVVVEQQKDGRWAISDSSAE